jgi:thiamine biosynthesis lipoprotein
MARRANSQALSRRRFIAITAGAGVWVKTGQATAARPAVTRWRGIAMGADASLMLVHEDKAFAVRTLRSCVREISRLEAAFSLYEPGSELSHLNRDGVLPMPSPDFLRCLSEARAISELSGGAFDISVQPLFAFHRAHDDDSIERNKLNAVRNLVDYRKIEIDPQAVRFRQQGMAATLNGIAQGYVCDRVSDLLRRSGFTDAVVDMGEIAALGHGPDGKSWPLAVADPNGGNGNPLPLGRLSDRAVATSAPHGFQFGSSGIRHHLIDPRSGESSRRHRSVTVVAPSASLADGLSTAAACMTYAEVRDLLARTKKLRIFLVDADGQRHHLVSGKMQKRVP